MHVLEPGETPAKPRKHHDAHYRNRQERKKLLGDSALCVKGLGFESLAPVLLLWVEGLRLRV